MSTLYSLRVLSVAGPITSIEVTLEHPDVGLPPSGAKDFALQILWDLSRKAGGALAATISVDAICDEAEVGRACVTYVVDIRRVETHGYRAGRWPSFRSGRSDSPDAPRPRAVYEVQAASARWLDGLRLGLEADSAAWSVLGEPDEPEPPTAPAPVWPVVPLGVRVALAMPLNIGDLGGANRGCVVEQAIATARPGGTTPGWGQPAGTLACVRVALDHGPMVWSFVDGVTRLDTPDTYERALADPPRFVGELLARPPARRAELLHTLALLTGGGLVLPVTGGSGAVSTVTVCTIAPRLYALLRRLPFADGFAAALAIARGFIDDTAHHGTRFGRRVAGIEYAAGEQALDYMFAYSTPLQLALDSLVLLLGEALRAAPFARLDERVPAPVVDSLRTACGRLEHIFLGTPASALFGTRAFLAAACDAVPGGLPASVFEGAPFRRAMAERIGLAGGILVDPPLFTDGEED